VVTEGLKPGDKLITQGIGKIARRRGAPVPETTPEKPAPPRKPGK
jgi:membrane fusion protein (multidrug efflux system)